VSIGGTGTSEVWDALSGVRDPELDESITDLGFVSEVVVEGGVARARLRLPTFFCAPNFAYLMVHDACEALRAVPGVREVDVQLGDHFASDEINEGVASERGFQGTFEGLADGELDELRQIFRRKALISRQDRLARALMAEGYDAETLTVMRVGDLPDGEETQEYLHRRAELGIDTSPHAPLLINAAGRPVPAEDARGFLRHGRTTRLSIEANAGFCRAVLQARYPDAPGPAGETSAPPVSGTWPSEQKGAST
jgi:metal-sulfur cluster biosynthetic enzyme